MGPLPLNIIAGPAHVLAVCGVQCTLCTECALVLHGGMHNGHCTNIDRTGIYAWRSIWRWEHSEDK